MEERDFFDERTEAKTHTLVCPHCGKAEEYQLSWLVRRKKPRLPGNADARDKASFAKAQSYMVRREDMVGCKNIRCRKRFDVAGIQSVAFIQDVPSDPVADRAARVKAAFDRRMSSGTKGVT
jgi:hypothetical protein